MPYIKDERREDIIDGSDCENPGELNFIFTQAIVEYLHDHPLSYQRINDVLGALEGAKLEFYRRVAVPYEHKKMKEAGDVY